MASPLHYWRKIIPIVFVGIVGAGLAWLSWKFVPIIWYSFLDAELELTGALLTVLVVAVWIFVSCCRVARKTWRNQKRTSDPYW